MKRLFSKKSGFTLVEIIIAFAVFAIMASMVMQVIHLTINRRMDNYDFEKNLQNQEKTLVAQGQKWDAYDPSKSDDGTLHLQFKDKDGNDMPMDLNYQIVSVDGTVGEAAGLNYFVGNITYADGYEDTEHTPDESDSGDPSDPSDIGGGSQMDRFDTRITGTKGINSIKVTYTYDAGADEYTFAVTVNDSGVDSVMKSHSQVSLFFGEDAANGKMATIKSLNSTNYLYLKKTGLNGVNIHCNGSGFNGSTTTFKVKFNESLSSIGFGSNVEGGNTYRNMTGYPNIFGAYEKAST